MESDPQPIPPRRTKHRAPADDIPADDEEFAALDDVGPEPGEGAAVDDV